MTPHCLTGDKSNGVANGKRSYPVQEALDSSAARSMRRSIVSNLEPTPSTELHDLICVGFGPASIAIAIAIHDSIEAGKLPKSPKVLFLEKQHTFSWHAGMLLPEAKMQISFLKDMATLRDPTSKFTFLNYLHKHDRLINFTNLNTFLPARIEYEDYLRWCASSFNDVVQYGSEVISVSPELTGSGPVSNFCVGSKSVKTGTLTKYKAKNVLFAIGGQPSIPGFLPSNHPRLIHSSQYAHQAPIILNQRDAPYRVAVIGAGQSAAEIFNNIQVLYPNSQTALIMRSEFLKPSDDSPFVNSIFNPSFVNELFSRSTERREALLEDVRSTNYGVVRLDLIEHLYQRMYQQQREYGNDNRRWPHRILGSSRITGVETKDDRIRLLVSQIMNQDSVDEKCDNNETFDCDLVIAATGYQRQAHLTIMEDVADLLPEGPVMRSGAIKGRPIIVGRDYDVQFVPGKISPGSGIWLQGCCEGTHGLSDTLLSILAVRSQEIVDVVFGIRERK
ncbi:L-lysine 6-monooxygenase (NADPH-requiring)-domain-containing protein [Xylaria nigripes]|nr:L-lysine 6-monooxygenase (NADPH-requiring)-domain-containing protein [Xylaria nigripes]